MRLTERLLGHLNRVFRKDPDAVLALRVRFAGVGITLTGDTTELTIDSTAVLGDGSGPHSRPVGMTWQAVEGVLTISTREGQTTGTVTVDLSQHTIRSLAAFLATLDGFEVPYINPELAGLSALALLDGAGDQDSSNGDHLQAYTTVLWSYLEALAVELDRAEQQVGEMLRQMQTTTAEGEWLDELGRFYAVPRFPGEGDALYGPRIIREVLRPRSNNVAIAQAILDFTGQDATVEDVVEWGDPIPAYDGLIVHDGAYTHSSTAKPIYGLFDVTYGYDLLNGGSFTEFQQAVTDLVGRLRAAGTHMRSLLLRGGVITDELTLIEDGEHTLTVGPALTDSGSLPSDAALAADVAAGLGSDTIAAGSDADMLLTAAPVLDDAGDLPGDEDLAAAFDAALGTDSGSLPSDAALAADVAAGLGSDALPEAVESDSVTETYGIWLLDGARLLDGGRPLASGQTLNMHLDGTPA